MFTQATPLVDATDEPGVEFEQAPVEAAAPAETQPADTSLSWEPSCQLAWEATSSTHGPAQPWRGHVTAFRVDCVPATLAEHAAALQALVLLPTPPVSEAPTEEAFAAPVAEPEAVTALLAQLLSGTNVGTQLLNADGTALLPPTPPPSPGPAERVRVHEVTDPRLKELLQELQPHRKLFKARPAQPPRSDVIAGADLAYLSAAAGGPYCVLRALSHPLRLSPFTLEALIAALATSQPSQLLAEVHTALLRVLVAGVADEDATAASQRPGGAPGDGGEGDGVNTARLADPLAQWAKLLDTVTWPAYARLYLRHVIACGGEVPPRLSSLLATAEPHALAPRHRVALLAFLTHQLMACPLLASELDARRGLLEGPSTSRAAGARSRRRGPSRLALAAPAVGSHVEVCGVEPGLRGSWYAANVIATSPGGGAVRVRYLDLLTDDSTRPLEEWVSLEPLGHGIDDVDVDDDVDGDALLDPADRDGLLAHGLPVQLAAGFERTYRVRPVPPAMPVPADVEAGSLVEVRHNDGWWHAQLLRPDGHRYLVRLPGEGATERIPRRDMRWALVWRLGTPPDHAAATSAAAGAQQRMGQWYLAETGAPVPGGLVPASSGGDATMNLDSCAVCHRPGQLLCCDSCPLALHYTCAGETKGSLPDGEYFCPECAAQPPKMPPSLSDVPGGAGGAASCGAWVYSGADSASRPHWVLRPATVARLEVGACRRQRGSCDALYPTAATVVTGRWATQAAEKLGTSYDADDVALAQRIAGLLSGTAAAGDDAGDVMEVDADAVPAQVDAMAWAEAQRYVNKYAAAPALGDAAALNADTPGGGASRRGSAAAASTKFGWPTPLAPVVQASGGDAALGCIAARCMHLEKVLFALCDGPWRKGGAAQRQQWAADVSASSTPAGLAARILDLERCLRRIVFHGASSSTSGTCGWHTAWEAQRYGVLDDKLPPMPYPLGGAMGESRPAPAQPARLPATEARRLGRRGGGVLSPMATYSSRGRVLRHWASRGVRHAWIAETQGCVTASQLALQLRLLDMQIRWEAVAVPWKDSSAAAEKEQLAAHTTPQLEVRHKRYILVPAPPAGQGDAQKQPQQPQYRTEYLVGTQGSNGGFGGSWMHEASAPLWAVRVYEEAVRTGGDPHAVATSRDVSRRSLSLEEVVHPQLSGSHVEVFWPATGQWYGATLVVASKAGGMRLVYDSTGDADDVDVKTMEAMVAQDCVAVRAAGRDARRGGEAPGGGGGGAVGRGQARERGDRGGARYVYEFDVDGVPEPAACVDKEMLAQLAMEWCGKDVTAMAKEKLFRRKVAGMLPLGVIEAAEHAAAAGLPLPRRPDGMAHSERALPRRMRKVTAPGHSDSEDDDTYIQRVAAQAQAKEESKKGGAGGGGSKSKAKAPKPEPLVFSLDRDDRRRAQSVLQALRQARGPDGSPMGTKFAHVPTRKESPEYHKVIKYPIDLNSIATFLQQKVCRGGGWG